jgi:hypothetical protein
MSRRFAALLVGAIVVLAAAMVVWQAVRLWREREEPASAAAPGAVPGPAAPRQSVPFRLFFPGGGGLLYVEQRQLDVTTDPRERTESIVRALLAGPRGEGLAAPLPPGIELALVLLGSDGTAFVDLHEPAGGAPPPSGSRREMLTVYSLVNSIVHNVPEARRVVLLWNGVQPTTFAGHLATDRPLAPSTDLVAQ